MEQCIQASNCMAGLSETFTHGVLLFALECFVHQWGTKLSLREACWIVSPIREVTYLPAAETGFTFAPTKKKILIYAFNL